MVEGSPSDPPAASAEPAVTPPTEPTEEQLNEVTNEERTPEQVEAIWKNRVAGKDRAHAAETATLREQIEAANRRAEAAEARKRAEDEASMTEAEQWRSKAEAAEQTLARERQERIVEVRTAKYGAAAEHLDEAALATMDEAKLASLNARLAGGEEPEPPVIDPSRPPRRTTDPAASRERGVAELESDLKKFEPEFQASLTE